VTGGGKGSERRGPWHHAAVAALQGASIEEQLQYLDPDLVQSDEIRQAVEGPGLGLGSLGSLPSARPPAIEAPDDAAALHAAIRIWNRWDVHARGRIVRR